MKSGKSLIRTETADSVARKILLGIGDAAEVTDTLYPWLRLQEAGNQVVVAAPEVRTYSLVPHQRPDGWDITRESAGYQSAGCSRWLAMDASVLETAAGEPGRMIALTRLNRPRGERSFALARLRPSE